MFLICLGEGGGGVAPEVTIYGQQSGLLLWSYQLMLSAIESWH